MGTIRCPKCRKMINEKDKKCCYCGFDGISSYVSSLKRNEKQIQKRQEEKRNKVMYKAMESDKENNISKSPVPKCPTCSSTDIKKIGSVNKTISIATFGIFSSKIGKQFECLNCGYKW